MHTIPCASLDGLERETVERDYAGWHERLRAAIVVGVLLSLLAIVWLSYAFYFAPRSAQQGPTPKDTGKPLAVCCATIVLAGLTFAAVKLTRTRPPAIAHDPGSTEESVRPDYRRQQVGNVLNAPVVRIYFVRCRSCGKTLRQWERPE
jgi:hypothetical protein